MRDKLSDFFLSHLMPDVAQNELMKLWENRKIRKKHKKRFFKRGAVCVCDSLLKMSDETYVAYFII
jgi:hypothetical protein